MPNNSGIIILGMHRSGTSLIAELVQRAGAFGRSDDCLPSNQWNARGYWELAPLVEFNERLLEKVGGSWSFPPSRSGDLRLAALCNQPSFRTEATALLASMKSRRHGDWYWKDPRLSLLLPFWQSIWEQPRYVVCVRDPLEICRSLEQRDEFTFSVAILLWQCYMLSVLERTRNLPVIFMNYSEVLRNPHRECHRLAEFLADSNGNADLSEMERAVDTELRHCQTNLGRNVGLLTRQQHCLRYVLEKLAEPAGDADLEIENCALPSYWRAILRCHFLLLRGRRRLKRLSMPTINMPLSEEERVALFYAGRSILEVDSQFAGYGGFPPAALNTEAVHSQTGEFCQPGKVR